MNKKKLKMEELQVQSFLTDLKLDKKEQLMGGAGTLIEQCSIGLCSQVDACITAQACGLLTLARC